MGSESDVPTGGNNSIDKEWCSIIMLLRLVTFITKGTSMLWDTFIDRNQVRPTTKLSRQVLLDAIASLLVQNNEIVAVMAGATVMERTAPSPPEPNLGADSSNIVNVTPVFAVQDVPDMDFSHLPLTNFAAIKNSRRGDPHFKDPGSPHISLLKGASDWPAVTDDPWNLLSRK